MGPTRFNHKATLAAVASINAAANSTFGDRLATPWSTIVSVSATSLTRRAFREMNPCRVGAFQRASPTQVGETSFARMAISRPVVRNPILHVPLVCGTHLLFANHKNETGWFRERRCSSPCPLRPVDRFLLQAVLAFQFIRLIAVPQDMRCVAICNCGEGCIFRGNCWDACEA